MKNLKLNEDSLLTYNELSKILKITPRTLYRWVDAGTIPAPKRIGGVARWKNEDIQTWIDQH